MEIVHYSLLQGRVISFACCCTRRPHILHRLPRQQAWCRRQLSRPVSDRVIDSVHGIVLQILFSRSEVNIMFETRIGWTAVHHGVEWNRPLCISMLFKLNADVNMRCACVCVAYWCGFKVDLQFFIRDGKSPLERAREEGHEKCIAALEAAGAK